MRSLVRHPTTRHYRNNASARKGVAGMTRGPCQPLPVIYRGLDEAALVRILTEPRNALAKQYRELLRMDDVALEFEDGALDAIAEIALQRKSGARGLRSIVENVLLDTMFEIPSRKEVEKCVITEDSVKNGTAPLLLEGGDDERLA